MTFNEAKVFLAEIAKGGMILGLEAEKALLAQLGNPQDQLLFIHVTGTNGKGSVSTYLASVLQAAGYRVGRYLSPVLFDYLEKIQINGAYISEKDFTENTEKIRRAMEQLQTEGKPLPTVFEAETALSFLYFAEQKVDVVILEVGMGGRTDATNVVNTTILSVMTSISLDHTEYLGDTLAQIAWNKSGIMRPGIPVVSAAQPKEAADQIVICAKELGCPLAMVEEEQITEICCAVEEQSFTYQEFADIKIHLAGKYQIANAALALLALKALRRRGWKISGEAVYQGMDSARWKGRFSIIDRDPYVILDGAHNPDAARVLRESLQIYFPDRKKIFIMGVFADKAYDEVIALTADLAEHIITIETPDNPRALPAADLAQAVARVNPSVEAAQSIPAAVCRARKLAGPEDVILAFGSLSHLAELEKAFLSIRQED